jgi:hypothetical protein
MVNDWSSKATPDLLHFVPYTWKVGLMLEELELLPLSNNWVDCSSTNQEIANTTSSHHLASTISCINNYALGSCNIL